MEFDLKKSLGEDLELYVIPDINDICYELILEGIVYEGQFTTLNSMVCKNNAFDLTQLFEKKTGVDVSYGYDNVTCHFVFYNEDMYSREEAIQKSMEYHK